MNYREYVANTTKRLTVSESEYAEIEKQATNKLRYIINKFGDGNGERLKPSYFIQLVQEIILAKALSEQMLMNKEIILNCG